VYVLTILTVTIYTDSFRYICRRYREGLAELTPSARDVAHLYNCSSNTAVKAETKAIQELFDEKLGSIAGKVEAGESLKKREDARRGRAQFIQGALSSLRWSPDYPPLPRPVKSRKRRCLLSPSTTTGNELDEASPEEQVREESLPPSETIFENVSLFDEASIAGGETEETSAEDQVREASLPSSNTIVDDGPFNEASIPPPTTTGDEPDQASAEEQVREEGPGSRPACQTA